MFLLLLIILFAVLPILFSLSVEIFRASKNDPEETMQAGALTGIWDSCQNISAGTESAMAEQSNEHADVFATTPLAINNDGQHAEEIVAGAIELATKQRESGSGEF